MAGLKNKSRGDNYRFGRIKLVDQIQIDISSVFILKRVNRKKRWTRRASRVTIIMVSPRLSWATNYHVINLILIFQTLAKLGEHGIGTVEDVARVEGRFARRLWRRSRWFRLIHFIVTLIRITRYESNTYQCGTGSDRRACPASMTFVVFGVVVAVS